MFPTDKQYQQFLEKLREINQVQNLNLCTGNCGMYALALKEAFDVGVLININNCTHVMFTLNGKYYDGEKIYQSFNELCKSEWGTHLRSRRKKNNKIEYNDFEILENDVDAYNIIVDRTNYKLDKSFFIKIIGENLKRDEWKDSVIKNPLNEMMRKKFGEKLIIPERMNKL